MTIWVRKGRARLDLFSDKKRGIVLDLPAGFGQESAHLRELGFKTILADLFPRPAKIRSLTWVRADSMETFPFGNETFDYVLSREGIEHFEDQAGFLHECARVTKAGGCLVVTTPNVTNLRSRLSYFLTCQRTLRRGLINEVQTLRGTSADGRHYHGHAFLIDYFKLRYLLKLAGFEKLEVYTDRYSLASRVLFWLVPILYIATRMSIGISGKKFREKYKIAGADSISDEIISHVFSKALLFGKRMIVVAHKRAATGPG
jgi:SAM-dependent methyltransferase